MTELELLKRRLEREIQARHQAEKILEEKSLLLFKANEELRQFNNYLESKIEKRSEELKSTELIYGSIVESASDLIFRSNKRGEITFINSASEKMLGYTKEEALGKSFSEFLDPEYAESVVNDFIEKVKNKVEDSYQEIQIVKKYGETKRLGIKLKMFFNPDGKLLEGMAVARDITEKHKHEEDLISTTYRLKTLISNMNFGVLVEDQNRDIVLINKQFNDMFGIPIDPELLVGVNCANTAEDSKHLFKDEDHFVSRIDEILKTKENVFDEILELKDNRSYKRDYLPIFFKEQYLGHLWVYEDISKEINDKKELIIAKLKAEKSQLAEKQFLAHVSHEIRTPLNAIIGMSYLLLDTNLTPEQNEYLQIVKNSSDLLLNLINDVLDFSKIEAGEFTFEKVEFELEELISNLEKSFIPLIGAKNVKISHKVNNMFKKHIISDKNVLNQILFNLIGNAVKFTQIGEIKIDACIKKYKSKYNLELSVIDTGVGIEKAQQKTIFTAFKQAATSKFQALGTGLGLAITKKLVELQGGKISLESEHKKGSTFKVVLPIALGEENVNTKIQSQDCNFKNFKLSNNNKVLVVEDNLANQKYILKLLDYWGFSTQLVSSGEEALHYANLEKYDLIFMDLQMPIMSGYEVSSKIMEDGVNKTTPIVALTASAITSEKEKAIEMGMKNFLTKPFTPIKLLEFLMDYFKFDKINSDSKDIINFSFESKLINYEYLKEQYQDDIEYLIEMFAIYLKNIDETVETLKNKKELKELKSYIHKVKPTFSMVGLNFLQDALSSFEKKEKWKDLDFEKFEKLIESIVNLKHDVQNELNHLLKND